MDGQRDVQGEERETVIMPTRVRLGITRRGWCAGVLLLGLFAALPVQAAKRALLVGVADYPNLPSWLQLAAPVNDVEIVEALLRQRGFADGNIEQLITAKEKKLPTRANILAALERLAAQASDDDFYYLYFTGHGSRQPARATDNTETDGMDEIFLPTDVSGWDRATGTAKNAILDDEIAVYIDRIRDRGADVWLVIDSCYSGTMTRGASAIPEVRYRRVDGDVLGIPDVAPGVKITDRDVMADFSTRDTVQGKPRGELIAFSAAQSAQTTPEMKLPRKAEERRFHGLFTYTLMEVMAANPQLSYQQLAQQVLSRYQSLPWLSTQPLFSASDMNKPLFHDDSPVPSSYFASFKKGQLQVHAGSLSLLNTGATVAIFDSPIAKTRKPLGRVTLSGATPLRSWAALSDEATKGWPETVYVELEQPVSSHNVNVAVLPANSLSAAQQAQLKNWLKMLSSSGSGVTLTEPERADILVSQFDGHLWFLRADQSLPCDEQVLNPSARKHCIDTRLPQRLLNIPVPDKAQCSRWPLQECLKQTLKTGLMKIANVTRMLASVQSLPGAEPILRQAFRVERNGEQKPLSVNDRPILKEGDRILFALTNLSAQPQDVSILFVDSQYGVTQLYPDSGQPNRLASGESLHFEWVVNLDTVGMEHLMVSSVPGVGVSQNLAYLQQPPLNVTLRDAMASSSASMPSAAINLFSWQVSP